MNKIASLDFESAGLYDDAVVLTFGLVISDYEDKDITFEQLTKDGLYVRFDYAEQIGMGRKTQQSVMDWWKTTPSPESREEAWGKAGQQRVSLKQFPALLRDYLESKFIDPTKVDWYDRNMFDMTKIQHIFEETLKEKVFWDYRQKFEFATALRFLGSDRYGGIPPDSFPPGVFYHHALHDAAIDHLRIMKAIHTMPN